MKSEAKERLNNMSTTIPKPIFRSWLLVAVMIAAICPLVHAGFVNPVSQQISYQGHLQQGAEFFSGSVPMSFRLMNQAVGGSQSGDDIGLNVEVIDGLFQVNLNFGAIYAAEAKWLEIEVDGQVLQPRQRITAAPLAVNALNAPFTSRWTMASGNIHYSQGRVGIGTATPVAPLQVIGSAAFGFQNVEIGDSQNFIAGGLGAVSTGNQSFTGGGIRLNALGHQSFVGGGLDNEASGSSSFAGGGRDNRAEGPRSFAGGGRYNRALGSEAFVGGGRYNCAGALRSWAGGHRAVVRPGSEPEFGGCTDLGYPGGDGDAGTFIWADNTDEDFVSTGPGQFLVRASNGMGINTNQPAAALHVAGDGDFLLEGGSPRVSFFRPGVDPFVSQNYIALAANGTLITRLAGSTRLTVTNAGNVGLGVTAPTFQLQLATDSAFKPGSNTWTTSSDERLKTDIEVLNGALDKLLALQGVSFRWRDPQLQGGLDGQQMGLIAQQVETVFPHWVGVDAAGYKTLSVAGFEGLVAEALRELREEKDRELANLRANMEQERRELSDRLAVLEDLLYSQILGEEAELQAESRRK